MRDWLAFDKITPRVLENHSVTEVALEGNGTAVQLNGECTLKIKK